MDYYIDISTEGRDKINEADEEMKPARIADWNSGRSEFRLSYYPHRLENFTEMLDEVFPDDTEHTIYGDFQPLEEIEAPGFYIHVMEKAH